MDGTRSNERWHVGCCWRTLEKGAQLGYLAGGQLGRGIHWGLSGSELLGELGDERWGEGIRGSLRFGPAKQAKDFLGRGKHWACGVLPASN